MLYKRNYYSKYCKINILIFLLKQTSCTNNLYIKRTNNDFVTFYMTLIYLINLIYPTFRILTHTIHINLYYHISTYITRILNYPIYQFHQRESMHRLLYHTLPSNPIILYPPLTRTSKLKLLIPAQSLIMLSKKNEDHH